MSKLDYHLWHGDDGYTDIDVYYSVGEREWRMRMYRDSETLSIAAPTYEYAPTRHDSFEEVSRLPKRVQAYCDSVVEKAKVILILENDK